MKEFIQKTAHKHPSLMKALIKLSESGDSFNRADVARFYDKFTNYRLLFRNKNINFFAMSSLEEMEDAADSAIYQNKIDKFIKSIPLMGKKYKKLKSAETEDLFVQLMELNLPHQVIVEAFGKIAAYRKSEQLDGLLNSIISEHGTGDYAKFRKKVMNANTKVLIEDFESQKILFAIYDYETSKALGSSSWCISYSSNSFNHYTGLNSDTDLPKSQLFYVDFRVMKSRHGRIGITLDQSNKILHAQDNRDSPINKSQIPMPDDFLSVMRESYNLIYDPEFFIERIYHKQYKQFSKRLSQVDSHFKLATSKNFVENSDSNIKLIDKLDDLVQSKKDPLRHKDFVLFLERSCQSITFTNDIYSKPSRSAFDFVKFVETGLLSSFSSMDDIEGFNLTNFYINLKIFQAIHCNKEEFNSFNKFDISDSESNLKRLIRVTSKLLVDHDIKDTSLVSDIVGKLFHSDSAKRSFYYSLQKGFVGKMLDSDLILKRTGNSTELDFLLDSPFLKELPDGFGANIFANQLIRAGWGNFYQKTNLDRLCWFRGDFVEDIIQNLDSLREKDFGVNKAAYCKLKNHKSAIDFIKGNGEIPEGLLGHCEFSDELLDRITSVKTILGISEVAKDRLSVLDGFVKSKLHTIDMRSEQESFLELERVRGKSAINLTYLNKQMGIINKAGSDKRQKDISVNNLGVVMEFIAPRSLPSATSRVFLEFQDEPVIIDHCIGVVKSRFSKLDKEDTEFLIKGFMGALSEFKNKDLKMRVLPHFNACIESLQGRLSNFVSDVDYFCSVGMEKIATQSTSEVSEWLLNNYSRDLFIDLNKKIDFLISDNNDSKKGKKTFSEFNALKLGRVVSNLLLEKEIVKQERLNSLKDFLDKKESASVEKSNSKPRF